MEGRHFHGSTLINRIRSTPSQHGVVGATNSTRGQENAVVPIFPREIFEHIADKVFVLTPSQKDYRGSIHSRKPPFMDVRGFMSASPALHEMGMIRWICVLTIRDPEDWVVALNQPNLVRLAKLFSLVPTKLKYNTLHGSITIAYRCRELICLDGVFSSRYHTVLNQFPYLHSITIDAHSDVYKNELGRFSYRDVISALPPNVAQLEITCAHGPDLKIIEIVRDCCPKIEALRLGRCTMFNRPIPCEFWQGFPFDHDAYIASDGTDDYAHSVAQEIASLAQLKHLRLGVYLAPSTTVLAHRAYHVRKEAAPALINWQQALTDATVHHGENGPPGASQLVEFYHRTPASEADFGPNSCTFCREAFYDQSKDFERSASAVMKTIIPSLEIVEWMDWFTPSHLGFNRYDVKRLEGTTGS